NGNGDFSFVVFSGSASLAVTPPPDSPFGPKLLTNLDLIDDEYSIIQLVPLAAPPNAVAGGPYYGIEGTAIILDASASNDPDGAIELYEWDVNGDGVFDISSVTSIANFIPSDDYEESITLQLTDDDGLTSQTTAEIVVENAAPILSDIIAPFDPVALGTPLLASASFSDPGILDTHDAVWDWGDSITSPGIVTEEGGSGTVNGDHVYTVPGVYTITLTLSDDDGGLDSTQFSYVVIYDNEQGFVTGGGWLTSPEGAFPTDPYLSGKANFGFVSKYKKGTTVPTGNTEFQFHAGDLNFHSDTYEWLVIAGAQALFKGTGTINGEGSYKFILTAVDGAINGGGDADKFRIKIWLENEETGEEDIIYDNQLLVIDGGSIKIHKG
ncbi:MAG: PKD domain-containing protein, partial [Candidatus Hodarchaeota archaeon]